MLLVLFPHLEEEKEDEEEKENHVKKEGLKDVVNYIIFLIKLYNGSK